MVSTVLKTQELLKNGEYTVCIRVYCNKRRTLFSTGLTSSLARWDEENGRFKKNNIGNNQIIELENKARRIVDYVITSNNGVFSFERFKAEFFKKADQTFFFKFAQKVINDLDAENRYGTAASYADALKKFQEYRKHKDISLYEIDSTVLSGFQSYMKKNGQSINGIGIYMRSFNAIYGRAIKAKLVPKENDPRSEIKIKREKTVKKALSKEQFDAIVNLDLSEKPHFEESRKLFLLSYYFQGMNLIDMCELDVKAHFTSDKVAYSRSKTSDRFAIKLRPAIQEILDFLEGKRQTALKERTIQNKSSRTRLLRVFDSLCDKEISDPKKTKAVRNQRAKLLTEHLRKMAGIINVSHLQQNQPLLFKEFDLIHLTYYSARHTYATHLKKSFAPISVISQALGHSDVRTTESYLDSFGNDEIDKYNDLIMD